MVTTSIWSVKGWLGKVVIYIENPDKTENPDFVKTQELTEKDRQGLSDVIAYAVDCEKTKRWIEGDDSSLDDENEIVMNHYTESIKFYVGKPGEVKLLEPQTTQTGTATFTEDEIRLASGESQVLEFMVERGAFETALLSHRAFSMQLKFAYN